MFLVDDRFPSADAAVYDSAAARWWSRAELDAAALRVAGALAGEKRLAFCFCRNDIGSILGYLGAVEAGHAVALLDEALNPSLKQALIEAYQPDVILSSSSTDYGAIDAAYGQQDAPGTNLWTRAGGLGGGLFPGLTVLLSTSGTTGSP